LIVRKPCVGFDELKPSGPVFSSSRPPVTGPSQAVKGSSTISRFTSIGLVDLPAQKMEEHLTMSEVFGLFGRTAEDTRWVASADSQEYLAVVLYLVQRNNAGNGR
jgi:hypothetical protein